jgi:hypothetical protein
MTPTAITTALYPAWVFPPTSAESSTPVRPHLLERVNKRVRLSAGGTRCVTLISAQSGIGPRISDPLR